MNRLEQISNLLLEEISERFNNEPLFGEIEFSENLAEMLDKFIILHIRMWKLEDEIGVATENNQIAELKKKIDFCFKIKRPQLIKAINCYLDTYITNNRSLKDENIKFYKGIKLNVL